MTVSNHMPLEEPLILELEENPFAEYMWMENEEEFDRQVEEELWEQDFIESCFNQMLEEEQWEWFIPSRDLPQDSAPYSLTDSCTQTEGYHSAPCASDIVLQSSLNPNAKEFTPGIQSHVM
ncbi:polyadenylate-binding protein-interacting protein 2-like [Boleophthalmus pectinirostris]|uniref:polyadenylate-binding protein-interacting protein 2-like n=1 Tax=Boleophthalmus pectinirostris TaxID=150288 RepID=UPI000A1C3EFE|nr:polyadenylate-binding protein-interacting protein 2-like [Boleophthalmus pectinirostris]